MITLRMLLLLLLPLTAKAQLQLLLFDGKTEKPATSLTDVGSIASGDAREIRLRARNTGTGPVAVQTISVAGQGFSVAYAPTLPVIVSASNFTEFRVRFSATTVASYTAMVAVNNLQITLRATVVANATVSLMDGSAGSLLTSGATIDFGRVRKGQTGARDLRVANGTNARLTVRSCSIAGDVFRSEGMTCPMTLAPGEAATLGITFAPSTSIEHRGSITIDDRTFALIGVGFDPPLPAPSIAFDAPLVNGIQKKMTVELASMAESEGNGTVTMEFQPMISGQPDDPAIRFTGTSSRTLSFKVNEGDRTAVFPTGVDTTFQTGTTAGTLVFKVQLGDHNRSFSFPLAPATMSVDTASLSRRPGAIDVSVTGFDNTRTAGRFAFTFYDPAGNVLQPGPIQADWTGAFTSYFHGSRAGGSFLMRATFPIWGDTSLIGGVEVELVNSAGSVRTSRIPAN
jgi:hypothetical protein